MKFKFYKKKLLLVCLLFLCSSLVTLKSITQDFVEIKGIVEIKSGNQMPGNINNNFSSPNYNNSQFKIVAIPGKVKQINENTSIPLESIPPTGIIKETNSNGEFIITLKPGKYTFFILKDNEAYRNNFDSKGFFTQTNITKDINDLILTYDKFAFY